MLASRDGERGGFMTTHLGWTGGQYSIYRVLLAWTTGGMLWDAFGTDLRDPLDATLLGVGWLACGALALGWRDRLAAGALLLLAVLTALGTGKDLGGLVAAFLLALHACVPPAPYGSWEARARPDPRGDWRMPWRVWHAAWVGLAGWYALAAWRISQAFVSSPRSPVDSDLGVMGLVTVGFVLLGGLLQILVVAAAIHPPLRRPAWGSILLWQIAWSSATGWSVGWVASLPSLWLLHLLAADPGWVPGRSWLVPAPTGPAPDRIPAPHPARLFYDGDCGFCHRAIRFVLAEEGPSPSALRFRFAPLGSAAFETLLEGNGQLPGSLPDSIVLELEDGTLETRATAVLEIASRLGGLWRVLSILGRGLPRGALDVAYDALARSRKRIFARPKESCPILPPELRSRFDL
jgi:predicted DCC family thiol-disulfide oxidoreductase YuxK